MKILVFSDSHGNMTNMNRILKSIGRVDVVFHLGDNVRDALKLKEVLTCPVIYVKGNTDFVNAPLEVIEEVNGRRFLLTHGHRYGVKYDLNNLYYAALEKEVDAVLFGHTHISYNETTNGILLFNPGSIGNRRWEPHETYGLIEVDKEGEISARIVEIKGQ